MIIINNNNNNNKIPNNSENKNIIRTVLLSMLLIFQSIEQATQVNFTLFYKILDFEHFKCFEDLQNHTLNILKEKLTIDCLVGSCFLKAGKDFWNVAVQTVMTSKVIIKFWHKFQIQLLWYSFTRELKKWSKLFLWGYCWYVLINLTIFWLLFCCTVT